MPCEGGRNIFSVAPIALAEGSSGFLYVALHGRPYRSAAEMLEESYIARTLVVSGLIALLLAVVIGLIGFALLTRRLRVLKSTVGAFSAGDHSQRILHAGSDEIGSLGRAFNEMADTIEAQVNALRRSDDLRRALVANISHDFRTRRSRERGSEGSGLGLAITREIAAMHGVTLRLESRPGQGTQAAFELPTQA